MGHCWSKKKKQPIYKAVHSFQIQLQPISKTSQLETEKRSITEKISILEMNIRNLKEEITRLEQDGSDGSAKIKHIDLKLAQIRIRDYILYYSLISNTQMTADQALMNADLINNLSPVAIQINEQQEHLIPQMNNLMKNIQLGQEQYDQINRMFEKMNNDMGVGQEADRRLAEIKSAEENERKLKISEQQQKIKDLQEQILKNCKEPHNLHNYNVKLSQIIEEQQQVYEISQTYLKGLDQLVSHYKAVNEQKKQDYMFLQKNYNLQEYQIQEKDSLTTEFIDLNNKLNNQVVELQAQMTEWKQQVSEVEAKQEADMKEVLNQLDHEIKKQENNSKSSKSQKYQIDGQDMRIKELNKALNEFHCFTSSKSQVTDKLLKDFEEINHELQEVQKYYQELVIEKKEKKCVNQCPHLVELLILQNEFSLLKQQVVKDKAELDAQANIIQKQEDDIIQIQKDKQQFQNQQSIQLLNQELEKYKADLEFEQEVCREYKDQHIQLINQIAYLQQQYNQIETSYRSISQQYENLVQEQEKQTIELKAIPEYVETIEDQNNIINHLIERIQILSEQDEDLQKLLNDKDKQLNELDRQDITMKNHDKQKLQQQVHPPSETKVEIKIEPNTYLFSQYEGIKSGIRRRKINQIRMDCKNIFRNEQFFSDVENIQEKAVKPKPFLKKGSSQQRLSNAKVLADVPKQQKQYIPKNDNAVVFNAFDERPVISNRQNMFVERPIENTPYYNAFNEKPIKSSKPKSSSKQEISDVNIQEKAVKPKPFLKKGSSQQRLSNAKVLADVPKQQKQYIPKNDNANLNQKSKTPTKKSKTETNQNKKQVQ